MDSADKQKGSSPIITFPMLKIPIDLQFMVPTFPNLEMFLLPNLCCDVVEKWLLWLEKNLAAFLKEGKPFFEHNMVVLFPDAIPYDKLGLPSQAATSLISLHKEICSLARMAVTLGNTDRRGAQVALQQAMAKIGNALEILGKRGQKNAAASNAAIQSHLARLSEQHQQWFQNFSNFMEQNLESGLFPEEEIHAFANYRDCPISRWIYEEENHVWFNHSDGALLHMEANHKHFHATAHVEAHVATQLRRKGLTSLELYKVKELVMNRVQRLALDHQQLLTELGETFSKILTEDTLGQAAPAKKYLAYIPWDRIKKDVAEWKQRIQNYTGGDDPEVERSLSHIGCPTGQRIEYALSDPSLYFLHEFGLKLLDRAHMQFHATGTTIYTLIQLGNKQDAYGLFDTLAEEEKDLLEHLKHVAPLLKITNAA